VTLTSNWHDSLHNFHNFIPLGHYHWSSRDREYSF